MLPVTLGIFLAFQMAQAHPNQAALPKVPDVPTQGQALVDGMLGFSEDQTAKLTIEGPAAKVLFTKMSDDRITSKQPTDECQSAVVKSGDQMECGHCESRVKRKKDDGNYWCSLNFETEYGKVVSNPTFSNLMPQPPSKMK